MWKKIKYLIDNIQDKDDRSAMSRRTFLFTLPALVALPEMVEPVWGESLLYKAKVKYSYWEVLPGTGFEILRYHEDMVELISKAFMLDPKMIGIPPICRSRSIQILDEGKPINGIVLKPRSPGMSTMGCEAAWLEDRIRKNRRS